MNKPIKVYSIGIDGLEPTLIDEYISTFKSYAFKEIHDSALIYRLLSTDPPMSPSAWSSIITGLSTDKHGIFDFYKYNKLTHQLRLVTREDMPLTIFDILNDAGLWQLLINIPFLYPPKALRGIVVSGLPASSSSIYTYPKVLGDRLVKRNFNISEPIWSRRRRLVEKSIIDRSIFTLKLMELREWDFLMTVYRETDIIQHFYWNDRSFLFNVYKLIDKMLLSPIIDKIEDYHEDAVIMIYGDHGFTKGRGVLNISNLLYKENLYTFGRSVKSIIKTKLLSVMERIYSSRWTVYLMSLLQNFYLKGSMKHLERISLRNSPLFSVGSIMDGGGYLYLNPKYRSYKERLYNLIARKLSKCNVIRNISLLDHRRKLSSTTPDYRVSLAEGFIFYPFYSGDGIVSKKVPPARRGTHRRETRLYFIVFKNGEPVSENLFSSCVLNTEDIGSIMLFSNRVIPPHFLDGRIPREIRELFMKYFNHKFKDLSYREYIKYRSRLSLHK